MFSLDLIAEVGWNALDFVIELVTSSAEIGEKSIGPCNPNQLLYVRNVVDVSPLRANDSGGCQGSCLNIGSSYLRDLLIYLKFPFDLA
jgi:hypothetical protein